MQTLKDIFNNNPFEKMLGAEVIEVKPGYASVKMLLTEEHLNLGHVGHGGVIFSLADLAFGAAANSRDYLTLSLTANITFLQPAHPGYVYAEAYEEMDHKKIPFIVVHVTDETGTLLATMTSSGYRKRDKLEYDRLM